MIEIHNDFAIQLQSFLNEIIDNQEETPGYLTDAQSLFEQLDLYFTRSEEHAQQEKKAQEMFDHYLQKGQGFLEWLESNFQTRGTDASLEEQAEYTWGSLHDCIEAYKEEE